MFFDFVVFFQLCISNFPQIVYLYSYISTTTGIAQLHNMYLHMHTHWSHPQSNCIKFSHFSVFTAVIPVYKMNLIRLDRYIGSFMITVMVSEILTFLYIVYFIYTEAKSFKALGKKYFKVWICGIWLIHLNWLIYWLIYWIIDLIPINRGTWLIPCW